MTKLQRLEKKLEKLNIKFNFLSKQKISRTILANVAIEILKIEADIEKEIAEKQCQYQYKITIESPKRGTKVIGRAWVSRLLGFNKPDPKYYKFKRQFIEPVEREFDKKGEVQATFIINERGIYHDSDQDYYIADVFDGKFDIKIISYQEVCWKLQQGEYVAA
jgi:hypothetical protein